MIQPLYKSGSNPLEVIHYRDPTIPAPSEEELPSPTMQLCTITAEERDTSLPPSPELANEEPNHSCPQEAMHEVIKGTSQQESQSGTMDGDTKELHRKYRGDPVCFDLAIPGNDTVPSHTTEFEEWTVRTSSGTLAILKNFKGYHYVICLAASSVSQFPTSIFPSILWWIHTFLFWRNLRKKLPSITPMIFLMPYVKLCHQWR